MNILKHKFQIPHWFLWGLVIMLGALSFIFNFLIIYFKVIPFQDSFSMWLWIANIILLIVFVINFVIAIKERRICSGPKDRRSV